MMDLDRPAKVRRILEAVERDRYACARALVGELHARAFLLALNVIENATHGPDWTEWDKASLLYDQFKDQLR